MQKHRIIVFATIALMVLTIVAGWFLVAQPQVAAADAARVQLTALNGQIATSQAAIAQLKKDEKQLPKLRKELLTLRSSIPKGLDSSAYITALNGLANQSGVTITSIGVQDGVAYAPPVAPPPVEEDAAAATDAAAPTPAPVAPPSTLVTNPLVTTENFVAIPITITATGPWANILSFVEGLQSGPRLILVSGLSTRVNTDETGTYTVDADGYIYAITTGATGYDLTGLSRNNNGGNRTNPAPSPAPTPEPTETPNPDGEETSTPTPTPSP